MVRQENFQSFMCGLQSVVCLWFRRLGPVDDTSPTLKTKKTSVCVCSGAKEGISRAALKKSDILSFL